jgi:hypothetical protein
VKIIEPSTDDTKSRANTVTNSRLSDQSVDNVFNDDGLSEDEEEIGSERNQKVNHDGVIGTGSRLPLSMLMNSKKRKEPEGERLEYKKVSNKKRLTSFK